MARQTKNLSLDSEAVRRGERFSELHGTSLSRLVSDLLMSLPVEEPTNPAELSPAVRRLLGVADGSGGVGAYRTHVERKYGQ